MSASAASRSGRSRRPWPSCLRCSWSVALTLISTAFSLACRNTDILVEAVLSTRLAVVVTDGIDGPPLGARILLFPVSGPALAIGNADLFGARQGSAACVLAPGAIGTLAGIVVAPAGAEIRVGSDRCSPSPAIPFGIYKVWAWHGIDHERWEGQVDLSRDRGRVLLTIPLERAWSASDTLSADLHVHGSESTDSAMPNSQRVLAQVAAGIQVFALSNHNDVDSAAPSIAALGLGEYVAAISSIELSSLRTHLGVYPSPMRLHVDGAEIEQMEPEALFAFAHAIPGRPIVQLNHPRFRTTALFDYFSWDGIHWPPRFPLDFDAVEVINGFTAFNVDGDRRIDDSVRDLYTLVDHGHPVAALGNSDTHDFNWVADGAARTLVFLEEPRVSPFDQDAFTAAIRAHRTEATTGPYLEVRASPTYGSQAVGPGQMVRPHAGQVWLDIQLHCARFVLVDRVRITVGGTTGAQLFKTLPVKHGRYYRWSGPVDIGTTDTWVGVTADGDAPLPPEQTGRYQLEKWGRAGDAPYAVISPILVDTDSDGFWRRGDSALDPPL